MSALAMAPARQGRLTEAAEVIARNKLEDVQAACAKGGHSLYVRWDLARGHYASGLTGVGRDTHVVRATRRASPA